ncbi:MAG: diaminopimelate decarboxylase [Acidobacteriia bacterium]|nr:diaminopimelate decarboxylase [Terriglobia bacterium]
MFDTDRKSDRDSRGAFSIPDRITAPIMAELLSRALHEGVLKNSGETIVFYDLSRLEASLNMLNGAFPPTALHAAAVKANPTVEILKRIRAAGHGCEVASWGELHLAQEAGFAPDRIVFDSPAKTIQEIEYALRMGVGINANTLEELKRIGSLFASADSRSRVGIRINPEIGRGLIETTSVAARHSKFGVSLSECRESLTRVLSECDWLTGVHVHIGSQGMSREQLLDGIGAVYDFFVEARLTANVHVFNIGGGLPAQYRDSDKAIQFEEYARALQRRCPDLFTPGALLITEFGRSLHASCGWVASKVEYVAESHGEAPTIFTHVGADMFVRKAYRPDDWHHDISVCDSTGKLRKGAHKTFRVAGPLCFAGDYLDRNATLPEDTSEGDYVLIHDAGAYTFSMWSIYNSRQFPAIIGYEDNGRNFSCLRARQPVEEIVRFWSCP